MFRRKVMIDKLRKAHLALAELFDAWRLIPRAIVGGYGYLLYYMVIEWYTKLAPYMLEGCVSETVTDCIVQAPTSQHSALVIAIVGIAAPIFGFYANTGKKWNGFTPWSKKKLEAEESETNS